MRSLPDATTQEVVFGGTSLATDTGLFPTILNRLIGTKFKVIVGYKSSTDVDLAMERGEVQGKVWTWGSLKSGNTAGWIEEKKDRCWRNSACREPGTCPICRWRSTTPNRPRTGR